MGDRRSHLECHLECHWDVDDDLLVSGLRLLLGGDEVVTAHIADPPGNVQETHGGDLHMDTRSTESRQQRQVYDVDATSASLPLAGHHAMTGRQHATSGLRKR